MAVAVYLFCALTALLCTVLLLHAYRRSGYRLLFWSGLCFAGLTISNALLLIDKTSPWIDLSFWRVFTALLAMSVLLYGLIHDRE